MEMDDLEEFGRNEVHEDAQAEREEAEVTVDEMDAVNPSALETLIWEAYADIGEWLRMASLARRGEMVGAPSEAASRFSMDLRIRLSEAAMELRKQSALKAREPKQLKTLLKFYVATLDNRSSESFISERLRGEYFMEGFLDWLENTTPPILLNTQEAITVHVTADPDASPETIKALGVAISGAIDEARRINAAAPTPEEKETPKP